MEYVIPVAMVLLIAAAGAVAFIMNAQRKTASRGDRDSPRDKAAADSEHSTGPGIGADPTPLADTAEHAGEQSRDGRTVSSPDAERYGGTGHPVSHYGATVPPDHEPGERRHEERERAPEEERAQARAAADQTPPPPPATPGHPNRGSTPESENLADRPA